MKRLLVAALAAVLMACGGDEDAAQIDAEDGIGTETTQTDDDAGDDLLCTNPPPQEISVGDVITGDSGGTTTCYVVEFAAAQVTFSLSGLTDNLSLTVGFDDIETLQFFIGDLLAIDQLRHRR